MKKLAKLDQFCEKLWSVPVFSLQKAFLHKREAGTSVVFIINDHAWAVEFQAIDKHGQRDIEQIIEWMVQQTQSPEDNHHS